MDKNEFKRLERANQKADKLKNRQPLREWGIQFEETIRNEIEKRYEEKFKENLSEAIDRFMIAIAYTLHFSEKTNFGSKRLNEFMDDLVATVDMFSRGEYSPEDYKKELEEDKIIVRAIRNKEE